MARGRVHKRRRAAAKDTRAAGGEETHAVWTRGVADAAEADAEGRADLLDVVAVGTGLACDSQCSGKQLLIEESRGEKKVAGGSAAVLMNGRAEGSWVQVGNIF